MDYNKSEIDSLIENFLTESVALSKGSQRVMNDKNMVINLADAIRDDARTNPPAFPAGFSRTAQKTPDEDLAKWFLENLDKIERNGYEGIIFSRDGVNAEWIVRRYIAGSHTWEDLTGVMNMNLRDWYILKNRNLLEPNHRDIPKFNSVRQIGQYMNTHYKDDLEDLRRAARAAAERKMAKSVKLVDNEDYRIYTTLNWAAGCLLGLGTQWCTANSNFDGHFRSYSGRAMLFQMFPYLKNEDGKHVEKDGKPILNDKEKYQFDAGSQVPNFMDITDHRVNATAIREKYPYIYKDLSAALKEKKPEMEQAFKELADDPTMQSPKYKIKSYEIDEEIKKLHRFVENGYFTTHSRPKKKEELPEPEQTQPVPGTQQPGDQNIMEKMDKDVEAMLKSLKKYDMLAESVAPVLARRPVVEQEEHCHDCDHPMDKCVCEETVEEGAKKQDIPAFMRKGSGKDDWKTSKEDLKKEDEKNLSSKEGLEKAKKDSGIKESEDTADQEVLNWMKRFSKLGDMKGYGR